MVTNGEKKLEQQQDIMQCRQVTTNVVSYNCNTGNVSLLQYR